MPGRRLMIALALTVAGGFAARASDSFIIRDTPKTVEQVAAGIKAYAEDNKWLYLAEFKLRNGQITAIKTCYPPVANDIWAVGNHVAAMMPCGQIAIYREGEQTRISLLHPKFMTTLHPDGNLERAAAKLLPALDAMLDAVTR